MSLAALVKEYRLAAGLTQEELAENAEVSARTISDIERGLRTRIYRDTSERLATALGLDESASGSFVAAGRGKPAAGAGAPERLPVPPTCLIGRSRELTNVVKLFQERSLRLVTLTGPGGVGKTRLAVEAAHRVDTDAVFVDLGEIDDTRLVVQAIARAVGLPPRVEPSVDSIAEHLRETPRLLVLDTFERVLPAAPDIAHLLAAAPSALILATSREGLRVRGEHEVVVPALDLGSGGTAVELFVERALEASPELAIDIEVAAEICGRLSGLPLAIELAAARVKHLPLPALREQLSNALEVLTQGPRDLPTRQRTMRDTIRWSYELLHPSEQEMLRALCAFAGGWTLQEATAVCFPDALEGCSALIDKSLITLERDRYSMLDVIREFGLELGPPPGAFDRHLDAFVALAERAEPEIGSGGQRVWLERLAAEQGNIRAALAYALSTRDGERATRLAAAVWRFWMHNGNLAEGRDWLSQAVALDPPAELRNKGLWGLGWLAYHQGDYDEAESCGSEMLKIATDDPVGQRNALTILGIVQMAKDEPGSAIHTFERCVELLSTSEPDWLTATSLLNLGMAMLHARDARADEKLTQAGALYGELGDERFVARVTLYRGYDALLRGDSEGASRGARDAVIAFYELDDWWGIAESLELSAAVAAAAGRAERAVTLAGAAEARRATVTSAPFPLDAALLATFLETIRPSTDPAAWEVWDARGRELGTDEAVEIATSA